LCKYTQNEKKQRFYKTFNNTMYTAAAQADVTTAALNDGDDFTY